MEKPLERFMAYDKIYSIAPHPNGETLALGIDTSGQVNLWIYTPHTLPRRVTPFTERRALPIAWNRSGMKLLFESDYQGNEEWQLHVYDAESKWFVDVVFEEGVTHFTSDCCWSPRGSSKFVYMANREEKSRFDLYVKDVDRGTEELVVKGFGGYQIPYWFENSLLLLDFRIHEDTTIYRVDLRNGKLTELTPHVGEAVFTPIGSWRNGFFMVADENRDFKALAFYDLDKKNYKIVWEGKWDVERADIGDRYLLFSVNEEGYSKLYSLNLETFKIREIDIPEGVIFNVSAAPGRDIFYIQLSKPTHPLNVYVVDLEEEKFEKVTNTFHGSIPEEELVKPESMWYESFDGRRIHSLIYKPREVRENTPIVLILHGGPESQSRPYYSAFTQYLVDNGVAVALPNFRGSSGYGKSFQKLIRRDWGGGELRDVEHLVKYLIEQPRVDAGRIGVFGGSFGGFLTLSCITRLPQYWKVAVEWFGPSNLVTFTKSVPPYWKRYMKEWVGDPGDPEDLKFLQERSPINYIDNIRCPILIVQGARDIRVVKSESDQIVEKLRARGVEVKYIVFEDEGHGFTKEANYKRALRETATFLLKHLKT